jgi:hypothetical protein
MYAAWHGLTREWLAPESLHKERFRVLMVRGALALIEHAFSGPADYEEWWVAWHEPGSAMAYEISLEVLWRSDSVAVAAWRRRIALWPRRGPHESIDSSSYNGDCIVFRALRKAHHPLAVNAHFTPSK